MFGRALPTAFALCLHRLSNRLIKILDKARKLTP
jgi:hypothetical protein